MGARAAVKYLHPHPSAGRLIYRRAFPAALRPFIPSKPRELVRTVGAKRIEEPGALDRYKAAAAEYDRMVANARKLASRSFDTLDEPTIAYLAKAFERDQAKAIEKRRLDNDVRRTSPTRCWKASGGWRTNICGNMWKTTSTRWSTIGANRPMHTCRLTEVLGCARHEREAGQTKVI